MKLLVINGANVNMLGVIDPEKYGTATYKDLEEHVKVVAKSYEIEAENFHSNSEGEIVDKIQSAYKKFDGIIINAGSYRDTSAAIPDALKAVGIPAVSVRFDEGPVSERNFEVNEIYETSFSGEGFVSYKKAVEFFSQKFKN